MKNLFLFITLVVAGAVANAKSATYFMYTKPNAVVFPECDKHTKLVLDVNSATGKGTATLSNHVAGACDLYVFPDKRTYELSLSSKDCGTNVYVGVNQNNGSQITVVDNRARVCENVILAAVITTEKNIRGESFTLYSKDN